VKAQRLKAEPLEKHRREKVLPGVLLHVIEAPVPIDTGLDHITRKGLSENMRDALSFIDHVRNGCTAQETRIVGLAA
jgi:hypothetical protein